MTWLRWVVVAVAATEAGFMVVDGTRALVVGDYITPSRGEYAGRLGPWAQIVEAIGVDPRGTAMKTVFVIYGAAWLAIIGAFAAKASWAWAGMLIAAGLSLWYLVFGTIAGAIVIVLLLVPAVRGEYFG